MFVSEPIILTKSLLTRLLRQPYISFLDCNSTQEGENEQSIIGLDPIYTFFSDKRGIVVSSQEKDEIHKHESLFSVVEKYIRPCSEQSDNNKGFCTGFIGMFTYESARHIHDFEWLKSSHYPEVLGGIYDRYIIIDHQKNNACFVASSVYGRDYITFTSLIDQFQEEGEPFTLAGDVQYPDKDHYKQTINKILNYIKKGYTYQVNVSIPYSVKIKGAVSDLYQQLRQTSPAPYSAYLNYGDFHVLSSSPELFFKKTGDSIITKPIKGTIGRGITNDQDALQKERLKDSKKDQAELLMIVDLERNDLNKICQTGTVKVTSLRQIKTYQHVHHGIAVIEGKIKKEVRFTDIMTALFPGGSITGAPKKCSMEIIKACELGQRGPYTGCIGYLAGNGNMTFNIAIRTLYSKTDTLYFHAGGGIVSDSNSDAEWQECEVKAKGMIGSILRKVERECLSK